MLSKFVMGAAIGALGLIVASPALAADPVIKPYFEFKKPRLIPIPGDLSTDTNGQAAPVMNSGAVTIGFEGISQYDGASFGRNFIPPDTNGAVGATQYMEVSNGAYAVFDKLTGVRQSLVSDVAFWASVGQTGANGDSRVMYNPTAKRWIAISFAGSVSDIQIAISNTSNALGPWQSTKFTGFAGGTADYPTLALDRNAVYIGTNNFTSSFQGTTLNIIPLNSLFSGAAPTTAGLKQFVTPFPGTFEDRGFAQQGVNSNSAGTTGTVIAASLFQFDSLGFKVNNTGTPGATLGAVNFLGEAAFDSPAPARQPSVAIPANRRVIDALDERISSSVYEVNGRIYMVHTVRPLGTDEDRVHYLVLDSATFAILDEGDIGQAGYDYYQGSIAVNALGQVVIGYNRSGLDPTTGKISFLAQSFNTSSAGTLISTSNEILLKESLTDDYHNGALFGGTATGRQRWGDYSQVSVDPTTAHGFYVIGQFAREYNLPQFGHPGGTGGSRWGTYIAGLDVGSVPEPASWAMMIAGFGFVGAMQRRRRSGYATA